MRFDRPKALAIERTLAKLKSDLVKNPNAKAAITKHSRVAKSSKMALRSILEGRTMILDTL